MPHPVIKKIKTLFACLALICVGAKCSVAQSIFNGANIADGSNPVAVVIADFTKDGKPDIATANGTSKAFAIFIGKGDGTFNAPTITPISGATNLATIAVGDFNKDGNLDLVIPDATPTNSKLYVFLGNGNGTFQNPITLIPGNGPYNVVIGDLNRDGNLDILTSNYNSSTVSVFLGNGNGTFRNPATLTVLQFPYNLALQDLTGDGIPDILVAHSTGVILVLRGDSSGFYSELTRFNAYRGYFLLADVTGDSKPDLITPNNNGGIAIWNGNGNGTFQSPFTYASNGIDNRQTALADLNADGKPDLITTNYTSNTISVLYGNGSGAFQTGQAYNVGIGPQALAVADLNGDNSPDVVVVNTLSNNLSILLNKTVYPATVSGVVTLQGLVSAAPAQTVTFTFRPTDNTANVVRTASIFPTGAFAFNDIPRKNYTLHIKGTNTLAANVTVNAATGNVTNVKATLPAGDADNNNNINIGDFGLIVNAYGSNKSVAGSGYDARADFNGDGLVDLGDFGLMVNNYGDSGAL